VTRGRLVPVAQVKSDLLAGIDTLAVFLDYLLSDHEHNPRSKFREKAEKPFEFDLHL